MDSQQIIDAATVPGRKEKLFCLGPFPRLVSFSAQQCRALNLVWALRDKDKFSRGDSIAVIGAGVAGLTAAAGFIGYGCKVDVYEAGAVAMMRQRATEHRLVHPTLNQWPELPLSMTTRLPFLEWYSGSCSEIVENLWSQFEALKGPDSRVLVQHRVTDIAPLSTDQVLLVVNPAVDRQRTYKLVLIAIGFGYEDDSAKRKDEAPKEFVASDYWSPDKIEIIRNQWPRTNFIVSGCGDGGLIDALRLVHRDFAKGKLVFTTAAELYGTPLADLIQKGEAVARAEQDPKGLERVYSTAADMLMNESRYAVTAGRLTKSLWDGPITYLLDRDLSAPYSLASAPIHKLLIRHAEATGRISFYQGTVEIKDGGIHAADKIFPLAPDSHVVIRHGAKADFGLLLTGNAVKTLKERQQKLADYHATSLWPPPFPVPDNMPPHDFRNKAFIASRKSLAEKALNQISTDAKLMETATGYRITYEEQRPVGAPDQLFGIAVETEVAVSATGIMG